MKNLKKLSLITLLILAQPLISYSNTIKILATINEQIITNYDLQKEIKYLEEINQKKISINNKVNILNLMIDEKIKIMELDKFKISINKNLTEKKYKIILKENNLNEKDKNLKKYLIKKIETNQRWNKFISIKYSNKLEINMSEIDEIMNLKKIPLEKKEDFINSEKNKKLAIWSRITFNEIKKSYFVKKNI